MRTVWCVVAALTLFAAAAFDNYPVVAQPQTQPPPPLVLESSVDRPFATIGEPFYSSIRIRAPEGYRLEYGEVLDTDLIEAIAPMSMSRRGAAPTAVYRLVAWAAEEPLVALIPVRVIDARGTAQIDSVRLRLPRIRSVLPAGDTIVESRPAKGVFVPLLRLGSGRWWLAILALALITGGIAYRLLSRRNLETEHLRAADPRAWALRQLASLGGAAEGQPPTSPPDMLHRVSVVLRIYLLQVDGSWSRDLTTSELLTRLRGSHVNATGVRQLQIILAAADRVKFAGELPSPDDARSVLESAEVWVRAYPPDDTAGGDPRRVA